VTGDILDPGRYAEIAAHLAHFPASSHAEVLARFGLSRAAWEESASRWAAARDAELSGGGGAISSSFVRAFVAVADRLQAQRVPLDAIGPLPPGFRGELFAPPSPPARAEGDPPVVEVARIPRGAQDLDAPSHQGALPRPSGGERFAATAAVSGPVSAAMPFVPASGEAGAGALGRALALAEAAPGPRAAAAVAGSTVLAPEPAGAPVAGELTLEQYTSLRVELHLFPERTPAILARYGLRPDEREAVFARWRARFEADPPLRMGFTKGFAQYLAWLRENPGALEAAAGRTPG
jgi:hypothetical protein